MKHFAVREEVVRAAQDTERRGLTIGTSGNVSARVPEGAIITPAAMPYADLTAADTVLLGLDGRMVPDQGVHERAPSTEHKVHLACYRRRDDVGAVVHVHPTVSSAFAAARVPLPAFLDEFGVYVGDEVRVTEYALSGSDEIAENAVETMGDTSNAAFLASHGLVCVGPDLRGATLVAREVERAATVYLCARILGGHVDLPLEAKRLFARIFAEQRARSSGDQPMPR